MALCGEGGGEAPPVSVCAPEKWDRNPGTAPLGCVRHSGQLNTDGESEASEGGAPTGLPMRQLGAGYHVALRATGLGECHVSLHIWVHGSWRVPGTCRQIPSWGEEGSGFGRREDPTRLLGARGSWTARVYHVTAQ